MAGRSVGVGVIEGVGVCVDVGVDVAEGDGVAVDELSGFSAPHASSRGRNRLQQSRVARRRW